MKWYQNIYLGEGVRPRYKKYKKWIQNKKTVPGVYLITLSENPDNIMEIISSIMLIQEYERYGCPEIIGMALGKEEAVRIVQRIVEEMYRGTGDFHLKEYLQSR